MGEPKSDRERIIRLEWQCGRIVSDIESEKRARAEVNSTLFDKIDSLDERLRSLEARLWFGLGSLAALQFLVHWLMNR